MDAKGTYIRKRTTVSHSAAILRPTQVEVNLARLTANYRAIQAHVSPAAVMPILKANAYGHGLVEVARHLSLIHISEPTRPY